MEEMVLPHTLRVTPWREVDFVGSLSGLSVSPGDVFVARLLFFAFLHYDWDFSPCTMTFLLGRGVVGVEDATTPLLRICILVIFSTLLIDLDSELFLTPACLFWNNLCTCPLYLILLSMDTTYLFRIIAGLVHGRCERLNRFETVLIVSFR